MTDRRHPSRTRRAAVLALALALGAGAGGCAKEEKDPAQLREEHVQARIEDSFSRTEASCVMKVLEPSTITALERTGDVPADSEAMRIYTNALVACAGG